MTRSYYRGAHMCILVCSATDRDSFESLLAWKHKVREECGAEILMVMVMNKMDLCGDFEVDRYEAEHVARMLGLRMFRTSVKNNSNIDQVFNYLVDEYMMSAGRMRNGQMFHKSLVSIGKQWILEFG
jgi:small GTP-binding protein